MLDCLDDCRIKTGFSSLVYVCLRSLVVDVEQKTMEEANGIR